MTTNEEKIDLLRFVLERVKRYGLSRGWYSDPNSTHTDRPYDLLGYAKEYLNYHPDDAERTISPEDRAYIIESFSSERFPTYRKGFTHIIELSDSMLESKLIQHLEERIARLSS